MARRVKSIEKFQLSVGSDSFVSYIASAAIHSLINLLAELVNDRMYHSSVRVLLTYVLKSSGEGPKGYIYALPRCRIFDSFALAHCRPACLQLHLQQCSRQLVTSCNKCVVARRSTCDSNHTHVRCSDSLATCVIVCTARMLQRAYSDVYAHVVQRQRYTR